MIALAFDADQDVTKVIQAALTKKVVAAARYLKNLLPVEVAALSAAGIKIISIYESTATRALAGHDQGVSDGTAALNAAAALGQPQGSALCVTVDFDATADQENAVISYITGFKEGTTGEAKIMVYANGAVCQAALDAGVADYTWLAGGMGMRGSRDFLASGKATIVQDVGDAQHEDLGISIDSDQIEQADFGGWLLPA